MRDESNDKYDKEDEEEDLYPFAARKLHRQIPRILQ
jgi:hypothetical protein